MLDFSEVKRVDPELYDSMGKELNRQKGNIELIASENIVIRSRNAGDGLVT